MSNTTSQLSVKLSLQGAEQVRSGMKQAEGGVVSFAAAADEARKTMLSLTGSLAGAVSVQQFFQAADAVTTLNNQLKLATGSTQSAGQAYETLFKIAQDSRVSFTELGSTFASVSRAGQELGISQQRLLTVTESIGNAMTISGGSAASMQAALVQLGQGIASGTLRGEELNSVMEQTPRLAKALADGLGVPIGKLREMGAAGQITSEQVISALEGQAAVLRGEVAGSTLTVAQAFTQLQNASIKAVGEFDKVTGASATLATSIGTLSSSVSTVGQAFKDNESAITTTLGVLAGASVGVALARTAAGLSGVATGIGGVAGAVTVLRGVVSALNPATLALLGIGAAVGGFVAYNAAQAKTADGIRRTIKELEALNKTGPGIYNRDAAGIASYNKSVEERTAKIRELRGQLAQMDAQNLDTKAEDARLLRHVASAKSVAAEGAAYDDLRTRLSAFRGDYAKYQADLKAIQEGMAKGEANGGLSEKEGIAMLTELAKKHGEVAKAATGRAKEEAKVGESAALYAKAMGMLMDNTVDAAAATNGYTKTQKDLLTVFSSPGFASMPDAWKQTIAAQAEAVIATEQLAEAEKALATARAGALKLSEAAEEAQAASADQLAERLASMRDEIALIGLTAQQVAELTAAKAEQVIADKEIELIMLRNADASAAQISALEREINLRRQLVGAVREKTVKEAAAESADQAQKEWKKASEQIEQSLTDALMRGFEGGKGFAENLRDTVENMFKTLVLRPIVSAVVSPVSGAITAGLGLPGAASAATSGTSTLSGLGTLGGSLGALGTGLGAGSGMIAGGGIGGWLTASTSLIGTGTAAGAMAGIGALAGPIGAALAVASLLKGLDDSGTMHTGGIGGYSAAGGTATGAAAGLRFGVDAKDYTASAATASAQIAQSIVGMLDSTATTFGQKAGYYAATAFADDTSKDGAWGALMLRLGDKLVLDWANNPERDANVPRVFANGDAGAKEYAAAVATDVRDYLITQTPVWADQALNALGDSPTLETLAKTVGQINMAATAMTEAGVATEGLSGWMKRIAGDAPLTGDVLQTIAEYPNKLLEAAGTSRDALVNEFAKGLMTGDAALAGQSVANMLVASIEQTMIGSAAGQIFDIINRGIVTPMIDAMLTGQSVSAALSQASLDAVIAKATATAQALGAIMNDPAFARAMDAIRTNVSSALGSAGAAMAYTPQYQMPAPVVQAATSAASSVGSAVDDMAQKFADARDSLLDTGRSLAIDLLRAQGNEMGALAAERADYLAGFAALGQAEQDRLASLYDQNQVIRDQITAIDKAKAVADQRLGLEGQLLQLQGNTVELRRRELAALDTSNQALQQQIWTMNDLASAAQAFYSATDSSIDRFYSAADAQSYRLGRIASQLSGAIGVTFTAAQLGAASIADIKDAVIDFAQSGASTQARTAVIQLGASLIDLKQSALDAAKTIDQAFYSAADSSIDRFYSAADAQSYRLGRIASQLSDAIGVTFTAAQLGAASIADIQDAVIDFVQSGASTQARTAAIQLGASLIDLKQSALDAADAAQKQAADQAAANAKAVADQRLGLENQLLQLQGNTVELRRRELAALDASNRALQQTIWGLQDFQAAQQQLATAQSALVSATDAVKAVQARGTNAYLSAQEQVNAAQKQIADAQVQSLRTTAQEAQAANQRMSDLAKTLREFVMGEVTTPSEQFADTLKKALVGDADAMQALPSLAQSAQDAARQQASSAVEFSIAQAKILRGVMDAANVAAASQQAVNMPAADQDPIAAAQSSLATAQLALAEALRVANAINAPLAQSVDDLVADYMAALNTQTAAQSEVTRLLALVAGNTGDTSASALSIKSSSADTSASALSIKGSSADTGINTAEISDKTLGNFFDLDSSASSAMWNWLTVMQTSAINTALWTEMTYKAISGGWSAAAAAASVVSAPAAAPSAPSVPASVVSAPAAAPSAPSVPASVVSAPAAAPSVPAAVVSTPAALDQDKVGTYSRLIALFEQTNGYINPGAKELYWSAAGLPGLPAFASGGVFTNGIVTRPTAFDIGLMGEAGDEAIMPLSRMPNGQLGVAAYSGGRDNNAAVVAELRELRTELQNLRAETRATAINTGRTEQLMKRVTRNGEAMQTVVAA